MRLFILALAAVLATPLSAKTPQDIAALCAREIEPLPPLRPLALAAFAAAEDRAFFDRAPGFSPITGRVAQILNLPGRGLSRLPSQALVASALSREEILTFYANRVFLGLGCYGLRAAARAYFGSETKDLALDQTAYLAGLPRAPALFHPERAEDRARARRDFVLAEMEKAGVISSD